MRVNQAGIELIKSFEGCRLRAYVDTVGVWTIGYGHTSMAGPPKVVPGMRITEDEAEEILKRDVEKFANKIKPLIKVELNDNQFSALVSFAYNVGPGAFKRSSVLRAVNNRDFENVPRYLLRWVKAGGRVLRGLVRRRKAEGKLFMKEDELKTPLMTEKDMGDMNDVKMGMTTARLRLRETPSLKGEIIGVMPLHARISIVDERRGWYHVVWDEEEGWCSKKYVKLI